MAVDLSMPILIVDDYNTMVRIIRNLLKQLGFENIDDASDGSAALQKLRAKKYGLVISDWNMEPMTGYDLLREVRADPCLGKTPFIMVTAESKTENVIAAKKAGVDNYIVKPFNAQTLQHKIAAVFPDEAPVRRGGLTPLPLQTPHHGFRIDARRGENVAERGGIRLLAPAQLVGMDAGGHEQAIDAEGGGALEIGAHRIPDRQHARALDAAVRAAPRATSSACS